MFSALVVSFRDFGLELKAFFICQFISSQGEAQIFLQNLARSLSSSVLEPQTEVVGTQFEEDDF